MEIKAVGSQNYQSYDSPKKSAAPPAVAEKPAEITTLSTDEVDAEIAELKSRRADLQQTLKISRNDNLQRQLSQIENELRVKDNDEYRRQHAKIVSGVDFQV